MPGLSRHKQFSVGLGFGTGLHLIGPIVWFNKGSEPRTVPRAKRPIKLPIRMRRATISSSNMVPPAPAAPAEGHSFVITMDSTGHILMNASPGLAHGNTVWISGPPQNLPLASGLRDRLPAGEGVFWGPGVTAPVTTPPKTLPGRSLGLELARTAVRWRSRVSTRCLPRECPLQL